MPNPNPVLPASWGANQNKRSDPELGELSPKRLRIQVTVEQQEYLDQISGSQNAWIRGAIAEKMAREQQLATEEEQG